MRFAMPVFVLWLAGNVLASQHTSEHPYRQAYRKDTFSPHALVRSGTRAGINQARNSPKAWGRGASGFGKRLGSSFATHVVKNTIEYPIAAWRHEDLGYHRSTRTGFGPRLEHALVSTVVTQNTRTKRNTIASGRLTGSIGSGFISRAWQPAAARTATGALASGGISLGGVAAMNVVQEFGPRHKEHRPVTKPRSRL
jgi:hypothetical protein